MDGVVALALFVILLPALVVGGVWLTRRPARFLGIYLGILPFGSAIAPPIGLPRAFSTVSSLMGLAVGLVYIWRWIAERPRLTFPSSSIAVWLVYTGLAAASIGWSIRPGVTFGALQVLLVLVVLFAVVAVTPIDRWEVDELRGWIAGGAAATGLYAVVLAATGNLPRTGAGVARFEVTGAGGGQGGDPNITAAALVVPIAIALSQAFDPNRTRRSRILYGISAMLAIVAVLLTASRGGVLSVVVVGFVTVFTHRRGAGSLILIALATLPAVLLVPATFAERVDNTGSSGRTEIWRLAIEACPEYCPTGSGFGTFGDVHEEMFLSFEGATGLNLRYQAHSIWFESLIEVGIIGFLLLVSALALLARDLARLRVTDRAGALAGLAGLLVANSLLSNLTFKYFWLALIYGVLVIRVAGDRPADEHVLSRRSVVDSR